MAKKSSFYNLDSSAMHLFKYDNTFQNQNSWLKFTGPSSVWFVDMLESLLNFKWHPKKYSNIPTKQTELRPVNVNLKYNRKTLRKFEKFYRKTLGKLKEIW